MFRHALAISSILIVAQISHAAEPKSAITDREAFFTLAHFCSHPYILDYYPFSPYQDTKKAAVLQKLTQHKNVSIRTTAKTAVTAWKIIPQLRIWCGASIVYQRKKNDMAALQGFLGGGNGLMTDFFKEFAKEYQRAKNNDFSKIPTDYTSKTFYMRAAHRIESEHDTLAPLWIKNCGELLKKAYPSSTKRELAIGHFTLEFKGVGTAPLASLAIQPKRNLTNALIMAVFEEQPAPHENVERFPTKNGKRGEVIRIFFVPDFKASSQLHARVALSSNTKWTMKYQVLSDQGHHKENFAIPTTPLEMARVFASRVFGAGAQYISLPSKQFKNKYQVLGFARPQFTNLRQPIISAKMWDYKTNPNQGMSLRGVWQGTPNQTQLQLLLPNGQIGLNNIWSFSYDWVSGSVMVTSLMGPIPFYPVLPSAK